MTTSRPGPEQLLSSAGKSPERLIRVGEERHLEAIRRLLSLGGRSTAGQAERFVEFSASHQIRIDSMWARLDENGRIEATVLAVPSPGRTAIAFLSPTSSGQETAGQAELLLFACADLAGRDIDLVQVLLEPQDTQQRAAFLAGGFTELARLSYMEVPLPRAGRTPSPSWPSDVTAETYGPQARGEMLAVLEMSYQETLDCPGLRGLRRTEDILAGHEGTGQFDAHLWTLLRTAGRPSGALLLNRSPANNTIELVYIGLSPQARGQGLGRQLLRHGLHLVAGRSERAMTLAVDDRNEPAIRLYRSEGFRRVLRRTALIRSLRAPAVPTRRGDGG